MSRESRAAKKQEKFEKAKIASEQAANKDQAAKEALAAKVNQKGGAGRLTKAECKLAERMGEGEGQKNS